MKINILLSHKYQRLFLTIVRITIHKDNNNKKKDRQTRDAIIFGAFKFKLNIELV